MTAFTTKEKIVELARGFIQRIGYQYFNYKQVAAQLNIKNAAIHYYYPAKEDLGLAVIKKDKQDFEELCRRVQNDHPMEQIEAILREYRKCFHDNHKMCIIGTFCSAYNEVPEIIQTGIRDYVAVVSAWLAHTLESGRKLEHFRFKGSPERLAEFWITALTGSLQIGRVRDAGYLKQLLDNLKETAGINKI
jgi:TetR/AcrR family transcriptional repressor of nem operon